MIDKVNIIKIDSMAMLDIIAETNAVTKAVLDKNPDLTKLAREILGYPGDMISASKSGYGDMYPKHVAVFNSNVVTAKGKVWYGDLDITLREDKLLELAQKSGETIYVLYEMDARFENEEKPLLENAVYAVTPEGKHSFRARIKRSTAKGKLKGKIVYDFD